MCMASEKRAERIKSRASSQSAGMNAPKEYSMSTQTQVAFEKMIFRKTHAQTGRHVSVTPQNSMIRHLAYGRVILNSSKPSVSFPNGDRETGLICLSGKASVKAAGKEFELGKFDAIYVPRDSSIEISTSNSVDLAEFSAEVSAKNVEAGRLVAGFTYSDPGNWTSWPPHEHAKMLEEIYVYFDMPEPAYGIQLVYNDTEYPELITVVRDGDAVLMASGYHPNVSVPGHRIAFLWAMAAHREVEDRQFGVVNIQPGFQQGGSGLETGRK